MEEKKEEWNCGNCYYGCISKSNNYCENTINCLACYGTCIKNPKLSNSCNSGANLCLPSYTDYSDFFKSDICYNICCDLPIIWSSVCCNLTIFLIIKPLDNCCYCMQKCHENCCHLNINIKSSKV